MKTQDFCTMLYTSAEMNTENSADLHIKKNDWLIKLLLHLGFQATAHILFNDQQSSCRQ